MINHLIKFKVITCLLWQTKQKVGGICMVQGLNYRLKNIQVTSELVLIYYIYIIYIYIYDKTLKKKTGKFWNKHVLSFPATLSLLQLFLMLLRYSSFHSLTKQPNYFFFSVAVIKWRNMPQGVHKYFSLISYKFVCAKLWSWLRDCIHKNTVSCRG